MIDISLNQLHSLFQKLACGTGASRKKVLASKATWKEFSEPKKDRFAKIGGLLMEYVQQQVAQRPVTTAAEDLVMQLALRRGLMGRNLRTACITNCMKV